MTLVGLGFSAEQIVKIAGHDGGSKNIDAIVQYTTALISLPHQLTKAKIIELVSYPGGHINLKLLCGDKSELERHILGVMHCSHDRKKALLEVMKNYQRQLRGGMEVEQLLNTLFYNEERLSGNQSASLSLPEISVRVAGNANDDNALVNFPVSDPLILREFDDIVTRFLELTNPDTDFLKALDEVMLENNRGNGNEEAALSTANNASEKKKRKNRPNQSTPEITLFKKQKSGQEDELFYNELAQSLSFIKNNPEKNTLYIGRPLKSGEKKKMGINAAKKRGVDSYTVTILDLKTLEAWIKQHLLPGNVVNNSPPIPTVVSTDNLSYPRFFSPNNKAASGEGIFENSQDLTTYDY